MRIRIVSMSIVVGLLILALALTVSAGLAGNPEPPGPPATTTSFSLEDIYKRLDDGTPGTQSPFTDPASGPGTGTMHSLDDIMAVAPSADNNNGALPAEVLSGKTYWGLRTDGTWGLQTGARHGGCTCEGTLDGTRWCDNLDGTVTDLHTCLVWLKNANCTETLAGIVKSDGWLTWTNAIMWSSVVVSGTCGLSDGSVEGDWLLPTKNQLTSLITGTEPVLDFDPRAFTGFQSYYYWSSTTSSGDTSFAWQVPMAGGLANPDSKGTEYYVWPVRGGP